MDSPLELTITYIRAEEEVAGSGMTVTRQEGISNQSRILTLFNHKNTLREHQTLYAKREIASTTNLKREGRYKKTENIGKGKR